MIDTIFRTYDIRGKVGTEIIVDQAYDLGKAIVFYFVQKNPNVKTIAVGMDGRIHSPEIKEQICKAILDSGLNVFFVGVCPSPVLYFTLHNESVDAGIMITASHNPGEYNGFKISLGKDGVWGEQIQEIKNLFYQKKHLVSTKKGTYTEKKMVTPYIDWIVKNFCHLIGCKLSVIVDCGNGAAGTVLPELVKVMKWKHVQLLYPEVDGTYPNHEADPVVEKNMQDLKKKLVENKNIDFGLGLDGDCDRMAAMTKNGFLVPGDQLLAVFAQEIVQENPGCSIVFDIKSSAALIELLEQWGAKPFMSPSGHSIIKRKMKKHNAPLGGELSCHFVFGDRYFGYDDGIYAMLRLFERVEKTGKSLQELIQVFPKKISSPEFRIFCDEKIKLTIVDGVKKIFECRDDIEILTIDGVRATMPYGWGIVRASNTQPVICLRFESDSCDGLKKVRNDFLQALQPYFDKVKLKKELTEGQVC
ncbi:phosphomannomutase/phosphoglucomutase [bacterium]|nr:phosphomannomutase/phosphoglucomutase [bacterium]